MTIRSPQALIQKDGGSPAIEVQMAMTSQDSAASLSPSELFDAATIDLLFWQPRFIHPSAVLQHVPFLFWLAGALRAKEVAVVGTEDGVAHFAFCQTMDKLNLSGCCTSYIVGDGDAVPEILLDHQAQLYDDLSRLLVRESLASATSEIAESNADLIFADLTSMGDTSPPYEDWLSHLAPRGVLVLHGTNDLRQKPGYGQALARRISGLPHIEFRAGSGMIVVAHEAEHPRRLQTLLDICQAGRIPSGVERVFLRLGQRLVLIAKDARSAHQIRELREKADSEKLARENGDRLLAEARAAYDDRNRRLAVLQSRIFDLEQQGSLLQAAAQTVDKSGELEGELAKAQLRLLLAEEKLATERRIRFKETEFLTRQIEESRRTNIEIEAECAALRKQLTEQASANTRVGKQLELSRQLVDKRTGENAVLKVKLDQARKMVEKRTKEALALKDKVEQFSKNNKRYVADNARLRAENLQHSKYVADLMGSVSWRVTAPIRRVKTVLGR